jgi:hypothetical protein
MKQIIVFLLLACVCLYAQGLEDLENRYIAKADALKADYQQKSVSLAKSYVRALEVKEKEIVKSGDLDAALKVRSKIKEIKAVIDKDEAVSTVKPDKVHKTEDPIIGKWAWDKPDRSWTFYADNTALYVRVSDGFRKEGSWKKVGNEYQLTYPSARGAHETLTLDDKGMLKVNGKYFAKRSK